MFQVTTEEPKVWVATYSHLRANLLVAKGNWSLQWYPPLPPLGGLLM